MLSVQASQLQCLKLCASKTLRISQAHFIHSRNQHCKPVISNIPATVSEEKHDSVKQVADLTDYSSAFKTKSTWELSRAFLVLSICSYQRFAANSLKIFNLTSRVLGENLTGKLVKPLFYDQFVAGDTTQEIGATIQKLKSDGIGSIVAVALESCDSHEEAQKNMEKTLYMIKLLSNHEECDEHLLQCRISAFFSMSLLRQISKLPDGELNTLAVAASRYMTSKNSVELDTIERLVPASRSEIHKGLICLSRVGQEALDTNTLLLIDAEYTSINPALTTFTKALSLLCNKERPMVWNTFQCYLKDAMSNVQNYLKFTDEHGVHFGGKIVRGAYMTPEKVEAKKTGVAYPVHESYEKTNLSYDAVVDYLLDRISSNHNREVRIVLASHNQNSIHRSIERLSSMIGDRRNNSVLFAQLYGMCDHISYKLANEGYRVYKSLAVGSVTEALPYLSRRAQENTSVIINARQERELLKQELINRMTLYK